MIGLWPTHAYHLLFLLVPVLAWRATLPLAKKQHVTILHYSSLAVSYWEELLFRGVVFGGVLAASHNFAVALIASSLLFGIFHLRNLWWSSRKQVLVNCLYAGLLFGPLTALLRQWLGDIYLGIAFHAVHNFTFISLPTKASKPTNEFLLARRRNMNWFEWMFSGLWLIGPHNSTKRT